MPSRRQKKLKQGVAKARREQHYQEEYKDIEFEGDSMRSLGSLVQVSLPETGHESFRPRAQAPQPGTCAERPLKSRESRPEQNGRQMGDRVGRRPNAGDDARRQDDRRPEESYGAEKEFWGEQDRRESHTTHTFKPRSQGPAQSENEHEGGYTSSFEYEVKVRGRNGREEMRHHRIRAANYDDPLDSTDWLPFDVKRASLATLTKVLIHAMFNYHKREFGDFSIGGVLVDNPEVLELHHMADFFKTLQFPDGTVDWSVIVKNNACQHFSSLVDLLQANGETSHVAGTGMNRPVWRLLYCTEYAIQLMRFLRDRVRERLCTAMREALWYSDEDSLWFIDDGGVKYFKSEKAFNNFLDRVKDMRVPPSERKVSRRPGGEVVERNVEEGRIRGAKSKMESPMDESW